MLKYIAKRLFSSIVVILASITLIFFLLNLGGGDPVDVILQESRTPETARSLRQELGLDEPILQQYFTFMKKSVLSFDLGTSWYTGEEVTPKVLHRFVNTLYLTGSAVFITILLGFPSGVASAYFRDSRLDYVIRLITLGGISLPSFILGLVLMYFLALRLNLFPIYGMSQWNSVFLPAFAVGLRGAASLARVTRSCTLDVLNENYIDTARAKGLPEPLVVFSHVVRNAFVPVLTMLGLQIGTLLGGTIVIETVFSWPGMGRLLVKSVTSRDFPVVRGASIIFLISFIGINFIIDLCYSFIDPRIRLS